MRKYHSFVIIIVLLLAGCSGKAGTAADSYIEPLLPAITIGHEEVTVVRGSSCWGSKNFSRCVDTPPPQKLVENVRPTAANSGDSVSINFNDSPNDIRVNLWKAPIEETVPITSDHTFSLPVEKGIYVYDINANWKEGSSSFVFTVEVR